MPSFSAFSGIIPAQVRHQPCAASAPAQKRQRSSGARARADAATQGRGRSCGCGVRTHVEAGDTLCPDDGAGALNYARVPAAAPQQIESGQNTARDALDCLVHFLAIRPDLLILEAGLDHVQREDGGRADDARDARARQLQREHLTPSTQHVSAPVPGSACASAVPSGRSCARWPG